jgi:drug/metabolite transporter superfamily protein YnfA
LTLLPIVAAIAVIPLTASLALKLTGSTRTALLAASLAAFNPYLVMLGPTIRAYSLLTVFSLLAINEFFHWNRWPGWWSGVRCAAAVLFLVLAHFNGIYVVASLVLLLIVQSLSGIRRFLWESRTLLIPLGGVGIIVGLAYWRLLPDMARVNREWGGAYTPPTSIGYIPRVFTIYMGNSYAAFLSVLLLAAGCWSAARGKQPLLLLCGAIILGPIVMSLQGVAVDAGSYARYFIFSLPLLLIFIAEGIDWIATHIPVRGAAIAAWGLTMLIVACWTPCIHAQFLHQTRWPYAEVARFLRAQMQKDDVIVAGWNVGFTLSQFFDHPEDRILLPNKYVIKVSNKLDAPAPGRVFYVTGRTRLLPPFTPAEAAEMNRRFGRDQIVIGPSDDSGPGTLRGREARIQDFGQIEVTVYRGDTARALLQEWREDLVRRTAGRIYPSFQGDYQLLALLEEQLHSGELPDHWRLLAERCRAEDPVMLNIPPHLQKIAQSVPFP